jgi:hypothetical protein
MKYYDFSYVIRSDDYYPVFNRRGDFDQTVQEIFNLGDSVQLGVTASVLTEEGTGNVCTFTSRVAAEVKPDVLLIAAINYAKLRDIDFEVTLTEYVEPEPEPEIEQNVHVEPEIPAESEISGKKKTETQESVTEDENVME